MNKIRSNEIRKMLGIAWRLALHGAALLFEALCRPASFGVARRWLALGVAWRRLALGIARQAVARQAEQNPASKLYWSFYSL